MDPVGLPVTALDTPSLLVDLDRMEANIRRMAAIAQAAGVALRPHIKTHKIPDFAKLQVAAGACGITAAKLSEAEVFVDEGLSDVFIAYPLVGPLKAERAARLARRCKLTVGADSEQALHDLSAAASAAGVTIGVRVEVDTGLGRSGRPADEAGALARLVMQLPGLELDGIFTFRSVGFPGATETDPARLGLEEGRLMVAVAEELRRNGIPVRSVSAGSTPTGPHVARVPGITEIRPGTYIFNDNMIVKEGACTPDQIALTVLALVVSRPSAAVATIDAGSKVFCGDVNPNALGLRGYGLLVGGGGFVERMSEEHGVVRLDPGVDLPVGARVQFTPNHVCTAVNLSDELYGVRGGVVERVFRVAARGKRH